MLADRLELDFAPDDACPRRGGRGFRQSYRFLEETTEAYMDNGNPPHISLLLGAFRDPHGELLEVLDDLFASWDAFAFGLVLGYDSPAKKCVWAKPAGEGACIMHELRAAVLQELLEDECSLRRTAASRGPWTPHVTLYRRAGGDPSCLRVKREIAQDLDASFYGPLVGYATGASLWFGDDLVERFPFAGQIY
ncbi:hypothetical protein B0H15DRAFT_948054 [Mycena belliarum]|uniref:2'-5' RNA ligase family protein n=1 Tax=Mycena belliarum TaxID=1033014 RepID=A0AAD6U8U4_9AGAR|nr:hypothetical protein B0H15DRAFT_948054 [Mycena belliae]